MSGAQVTGTLKDRIYADLRRSIIMGHRIPGEKIQVRRLADEYGTSVTPVREALQMLDQEELVTIRPHSGYLVTQITLKQLDDLLALREIVELAAVERAAGRISAAELERLETISAGYTGDDDASYDRYTDENRAFHTAIALASGNYELAETVGHLHDRLARFMVLCRAGRTMQASHQEIIQALRSGDAILARQALQRELAESRRVILEVVIQREGTAWHIGSGAS